MKVVVLSLCMVIVSFFTGCMVEETGNPEENENIIFITVDTLRSDHVGAYGNDIISTPFMDGLAKEGIVFENMYSQTHFTTPSHISMFTSLYLKEHGSYIMEKQELDRNLKTFPMILKENGYTNGAIISMSAMRPEMVRGIDRGFDYFKFPLLSSQCTADVTMDRVEKWLKKNKKRKFFLWLHVYDPHMPYTPPEEFSRKYYKGDPYSGEDTMSKAVFAVWWQEKYHVFIDWLNPIKDINFPATQYMGEISFADYQLGRLKKKLAEYKLDNTWIILTSDHGEDLGEHGVLFDHQGLYETTLKVPFIMWNKKKLKHDRKDCLTMSIDIMPTMLDFLGIDNPAHMSGKSLMPVINGKTDKVHDYVFAEGHINFAASVFDGQWRYTEVYKDYDYSSEYRPRAGSFELYRYPDEELNVYDQNKEIAEKYRKVLSMWKESTGGKYVTANPVMTEEEKKILESLGYVQ